MRLSDFWPVFTTSLYVLNIAIAVYSSVKLISNKRDPVKTLSWVMVMMLLPYIGVILYFFFGRNFRKDKMFSRKGARDLKLRKELCREMLEKFGERDNIPQEVRRCHKIIVQNLKSAHSLLEANEKVEIVFSGKDNVTAMYAPRDRCILEDHIKDIPKRHADCLDRDSHSKIAVFIVNEKILCLSLDLRHTFLQRDILQFHGNPLFLSIRCRRGE